jgi:hypothetical protein
VGDLLWACVTVVVLSIPLALSVWALLDAAHRPAWAWALAERRQIAWIAAACFGIFSLLPGIFIACWYLLKVRPQVAAAEEGRFRT